MVIKLSESTLLKNLLLTVQSHEFYFLKYTFENQVMNGYYYLWRLLFMLQL